MLNHTLLAALQLYIAYHLCRRKILDELNSILCSAQLHTTTNVDNSDMSFHDVK